MISSYRLGDLVLISLNEYEKNEILNDFPNSIASEFIIEKQKNQYLDNIDLITNIVLNYIEINQNILPHDIENSTVIHLRLGDVVCGNESHEKLKRPFNIDYLHSKLPNNNNKIYVIGKPFFAKTSSLNYDECIHSSNIYLQNVINSFNAEHFDGGNPDIDLCCAIKSKCFLQGRGFFSKLIVEIRKKLNLETIETITHD